MLPRVDEIGSNDLDIAVVGVPFDSGVSYRPGARFGPSHVRESSRLLRPYNPAVDLSPFGVQQVADAGDIAANPFSLEEAVQHGQAIHDLHIMSQTAEGKDFMSNATVQPGESSTFTATFSKAGTLKFQCDYHLPDMVGTITVK